MDKKTNKFWILIICSMSSFLTPFMGTAINLALPQISKELSMDAVLLSWVATAYNLSAAMFLVPLGRYADIKGREMMFKSGIILTALFSFFSIFVTTGTLLIALRFFQGIGGAMIFGSSTAILISAFHIKERGKVLGINLTAVYLGGSLGPILGGILTHNYGWESIFIFIALIGTIVTLLSLFFMTNQPTGFEHEKFDLVGSYVYALSLTLIMLGFSSLPSFTGIILLFFGITGIFMFCIIETKISSPALNIKVFRGNIVFIFSNLAALINYSATFAVGFLISLYLQYLKGLTPQHAGFILVIYPVTMVLFSSLAGHISDKIEPRLIASAGMVFTTIGLVFFIFLNSSTSISLILFSLFLIGFGFALFSSPNTNAALSTVEKKYFGVASAVLGTMRLIGQMLSMGAIMMIFSHVMGRTQILPENYDLFLKSSRIAFILFSILCFTGIFASLSRGNLRREKCITLSK